MMFLRLLCLAFGVLVLVAPPMVAFPVGAAAPNARLAVMFMLCMGLASAAFFLIGMAGYRLRRSPSMRALAALLLAPPCVGSIALLWHGAAPALLWMCSMLIGFALVLYLTLIYRVVPAHSRRPLRQREAREPALTALPPT